MKSNKLFKRSRTGSKVTVITGVIVLLASIVIGGLFGYYMRSSQTIYVETLGDTVMINDHPIPYYEELTWYVSAGDTWYQYYNISNMFSKPVTVYLHSNYTEPSLTFGFFDNVSHLPITSVTVNPGSFYTVNCTYSIDFLTDITYLLGNVSFDSHL